MSSTAELLVPCALAQALTALTLEFLGIIVSREFEARIYALVRAEVQRALDENAARDAAMWKSVFETPVHRRQAAINSAASLAAILAFQNAPRASRGEGR